MLQILKDAEALSERIRGWRRHLHSKPELSGQERETAGFIAAELRQLGLTPVERVGGTWGVTATIGDEDKPVVALRADMDALPVQEETGLEYASQIPGVMHSCGHDAHMAMLLGTATLLKAREASLDYRVRFIFQPQEELPPGGAQPMIAAGVLEGVRSILGLHVWSRLPVGILGVRVGPFMSAVNDFSVMVRGRGGHAAMPQECVDPIVAAAQMVLGWHTIVSRSVAMTDAAVLSVTKMEAGSATNIIPEFASLWGTVRALDGTVHAHLCDRLCAVAEGVARAHRAAVDVEIMPGYPVLVNDEGAVAHVVQLARRLGWDEQRVRMLPAQGGGEDFAYYTRQVPGAFVFLGAGSDVEGESFSQHHPRFDIDESILPMGAALLAQYAIEPYLT
jgi:amidohydrolase